MIVRIRSDAPIESIFVVRDRSICLGEFESCRRGKRCRRDSFRDHNQKKQYNCSYQNALVWYQSFEHAVIFLLTNGGDLLDSKNLITANLNACRIDNSSKTVSTRTIMTYDQLLWHPCRRVQRHNKHHLINCSARRTSGGTHGSFVIAWCILEWNYEKANYRSGFGAFSGFSFLYAAAIAFELAKIRGPDHNA